MATVLAVLACPGCHSFSLHALSAAGRGAPWRGPPGGGGGSLPASRARALRAPLGALRASADADADADAGLSKEQKLKKYQNLAVELITKANKLPPG